MKLASLLSTLSLRYPGLVTVAAWGETSLFYNPQNIFKRGTYCFTFKEKDGTCDSSSGLNREGVDFRMNFKIDKDTFLKRFGETSLPARPSKGNTIKLASGTGYDPTVLDRLIPHPVYGWMGWVSITNPSPASIQELFDAGLLDESYLYAVASYNERKRKVKVNRFHSDNNGEERSYEKKGQKRPRLNDCTDIDDVPMASKKSRGK